MILSVEEHKTFSVETLNKLGQQKDEYGRILAEAFKAEAKNPVKTYLGIDGSFKAGFYVGCSWLKEPSSSDKEGIAIQVKPKVDVDYVKMFVTALSVVSNNESEYFSDYYGIDFNATAVKIKTEDDLATPLLLLHYISLLTMLAKSGLKKGYVRKEENLQSKVRGKILFSQHLKQNFFNKRNERTYCGFQEYSVNTPENRLLKKALVYAREAILFLPSLKNETERVLQNVSYLENVFVDVSDDISLAQVSIVKESKLFRHYAEATKVAKMILQHFDYGIANDDRMIINHSIRPFFIDMARLYEMYVYHKLNEAYPGQMKFQVKGRHKTQVDYVKTDEKIILDAKYKPRYEKGNRGIVDDVREISGYARDKKILKALQWNANVDGKSGKLLPNCVIIYPIVQVEENDDGESLDVVTEDKCRYIAESMSFDPAKTIVEQCDEIKAFEGFYKIAVPLPTKV